MMRRMRDIDREERIVLPAEATSAISMLRDQLPADAMAQLFASIREDQPWHLRERRELIERVRAASTAH